MGLNDERDFWTVRPVPGIRTTYFSAALNKNDKSNDIKRKFRCQNWDGTIESVMFVAFEQRFKQNKAFGWHSKIKTYHDKHLKILVVCVVLCVLCCVVSHVYDETCSCIKLEH